jgi:ribosomal protein S18 acetylase RimI-like enzyme
VQVSAYEPEDAGELVRMWRSSFERGVGITDPNPIEGQLKYFLDVVVPQNTVRVAKDGAFIVGFLASTPETVSQLYVHVAYMGRGIGTHLLDHAKTESVGSLWLYTFARNTNARRFYERHGFVEVERESANMYKLEAIKCRWLRGPSKA